MKKNKNDHKTCGQCTRYGDLHSSCGLVRDFKVSQKDIACDWFKESKLGGCKK